MLTYTPDGGQTVTLNCGKKDILVFPDEKGARADLVLLSTPEKMPTDGTLSWAGEYDIDGVSVRGIGHDEGERVSYVVETDGVRTAFLASPIHDWADFELELLGDIDVLIIPCDEAKLVQKLVDEIDPRVLIPFKGKDEAVYKEVLKAMGAQDKQVEKSFKLKSALPSEGREVVVLK